MKKGCEVTFMLIIGLVIVLIFSYLILFNRKTTETFKVVGGSPNCPYKTDESCPWVKQGTGPACQIK